MLSWISSISPLHMMIPVTAVTMARLMTLTGDLFSRRQTNALRRTSVVLALVLTLAALGCQGSPSASAPGNSGGKQPTASYGYEVVHVWPHDPNAFTQGLVFHDGKLLESTGEVGRSSLRRVEMETGRVLQKIDVPAPYFAEGITLLKGKIYQLTVGLHLRRVDSRQDWPVQLPGRRLGTNK
jgi:hypothetical protein